MGIKKYAKKALAAFLAASTLTASSSALNAMAVESDFPAANAGTMPLVTAGNTAVTFTESKGYEEGAYAEWAAVDGADGYNVYCDGVQIDSMLIRQYAGYFRADAVGIKAGSHKIKVVPTKGGSEMTSAAAETTVTSTSYDRSGFCFAKSSITGGSGIGAYNDDGTLKSDAVVLYVTEDTKNTVTMDVKISSSKTQACTGISEILKAMQKGAETRPVDIRIIGKVTIDGINGSGDTNNMLLKASSESSPIQNITIEGIGEDAVCYGWGIRCNRAKSIEIRNLAVMLFGDDGIALETANYNIWVHDNDIFYGSAGSDADQVKGDGSMDLKNDSKYITVSYNHFWDSGKMSLCGMKSETGENWISYHHNWFDHSDSRHPRIRTMSVHVYNNYYDGNAKYGVGVTMGGNAFVESNYYRNCKYPMLISMQGSDISSGEGGTFSGENGGMIKSFGNYMEGHKAYVTYKDDNTQFDAYEASSRDEKVPASIKCVKGGTSYNNFDTDSSIMYSYTPDTAEAVPSKVMELAGRLNGGDFEWEFNDAADDADYSVNKELMNKITSYQSSVIAIGSGFGNQPDVTTTTTATTKNSNTSNTTVTTKGSSNTQAPVSGGYVHDFTANGVSSTFYTITGNLSTGKGTVNYDGKTLTQCLKMESATNIAFTAPADGNLTLVFAEAGKTVKVDGTKYTTDASGIATVSLKAGAHTITKGDSISLFYMVYGTTGPIVTTKTTESSGGQTTKTTAKTTNSSGSVSDNITGEIKVVNAGGWNEMMYMTISGASDADVTSVSYSGPTNGKLTGADFEYLVRNVDKGVRVDITGLKPGTYSLTMETTKGSVTRSGIVVGAQDRSGYAHYNYTAGVGAYNDDGTLKSNAIVLYVTEDNKDTVSVTSKDGTTVKGIGHILNSAGMDNGTGKTANGGAPNNNNGIIAKLAADGTPLVVRIVGNVTAPDGVTVFDSVDNGGSVGDNGYMARMKSGKDITIEGIGTDACVDGWGFHFMAESAKPDFGKSFEVRNIAFRNVPEDCVGMEGVQEGSTLTASVERCWIHNCEFYVPKIANPAESDKAEGDGACDFKRGQYFTNSYCYYEGYHKTNLVGASDSNLQFHLTYHHNYWKNCESRGPLARQANIHMYNNVFDGQTSYCMNPRANAYIFSEYNVFKDSKNPMQVKLGAIKSYMDEFTNVKGDQQGTIVTDKSTKVDTANKYANFDTNASICYIPSGNYKLDTANSPDLFTNLKDIFEKDGGCMDETSISDSTGSDTTTTTTTVTTGKTDTTTTTTVTTKNTESTDKTTTTTKNGGTEVKYGDVNLDSKITMVDMVYMTKYLTGAVKFNDNQKANGDCAKDGAVDASDATALLQFLGEKIEVLPVQVG